MPSGYIPGGFVDWSGGGSSGGGVSVSGPEEELYAGLAAAPAVNATNLDYLRTGIPNYSGLTQTESGNIASLLHPTDFSDQFRLGAEQAVAGGYSGSPFADANTLKLTEDERIRRMLLGSQMLTGAAGRLPAPFNPASFLGRGTTPPAAPVAPGVTYRGGPAGGSGGPPTGLQPGGPQPNPPGAPGTTGNSWLQAWLNAMINPAPGAAAPGSAPSMWGLTGGMSGVPGSGDWQTNPVTGLVDYNTDESGQAVDAYGEPINYNPVFTGGSEEPTD